MAKLLKSESKGCPIWLILVFLLTANDYEMLYFEILAVIEGLTLDKLNTTFHEYIIIYNIYFFMFKWLKGFLK